MSMKRKVDSERFPGARRGSMLITGKPAALAFFVTAASLNGLAQGQTRESVPGKTPVETGLVFNQGLFVPGPYLLGTTEEGQSHF